MKIMLHGYFGYGNIGDEAIVEVLLNELTCDNEVTILSVNPDYIKRLHRINAIKEKTLSMTFWREFLLSSHIVFAGGGRYGSSTLRRMALLTFIAKLLHKTVEIRSAGIYPYEWSGEVKMLNDNYFFNPLTRFFLRLAFNRLDFLSVRDKSSYVFLKRLGIQKVKLEEDLAIRLKPRHNNKLIEFVRKRCCLRPVVGVNLRTLKPEIRAPIVNEVAKFLDMISQDGFCPIFIPFGHGSFKGRFFDDDYIIYNELANSMSHSIYVLRGMYKPSEILGLFKEFKIFVGMRLHSLVFAYMMGTPAMALVYDTKVRDFLETHKWLAKAVDLNELNAQRLYDVFKEILSALKEVDE